MPFLSENRKYEIWLLIKYMQYCRGNGCGWGSALWGWGWGQAVSG